MLLPHYKKKGEFKKQATGEVTEILPPGKVI